jgi:hypothetical protein
MNPTIAITLLNFRDISSIIPHAQAKPFPRKGKIDRETWSHQSFLLFAAMIFLASIAFVWSLYFT